MGVHPNVFSAMRYGVVGVAFVVGFLTCAAWNRNFGSGSADAAGSGGDLSSKGARDHSAFGENSERRRTQQEKKINSPKPNRSLLGLESIAADNPQLLKRLNLGFALFDSNLDPNAKNWEMLGINKDTASEISKSIKETFSKLEKFEATTAKTLDYSDSRATLFLPRLDPSTAFNYATEVENSLSIAFEPNMARELANSLLERGPNTAGVLGKDRVLTVTLTSDETFSKTNRGYQVRFQVLNESKVPLADRLKNLAGQTSYDGTTIFDQTPPYLSNLIGKTGQ